MDYQLLADLLFPDVTVTPEEDGTSVTFLFDPRGTDPTGEGAGT